jgi:hypothetical protein
MHNPITSTASITSSPSPTNAPIIHNLPLATNMKSHPNNSQQSFSVTTNDNSPRSWGRYSLLHSPKQGILSRSMFPFAILLFSSGVILGGVWRGTVGILGTNANLSASPKAQVAMLSTDPSFTSLRGEHSDSLKVAWLVSYLSINFYLACFKRI